jgi:pimeloyl-ACP methyl ester carboxylesterase
MKPAARFLAALGLTAALWVPCGIALAQAMDGTLPQVYPEGIRGGSEVVPEKGVEIRQYVFKETGEKLPYSVFVSSRIKKGHKAPLVLALRGYTGTTLTFVRGTAVDLAETGGYILVGAIGYNNRAGFGMETPSRPPGPPPAAATRLLPPLVGGSQETDPQTLTGYSEKDVMNVLAMVHKEFSIDERRIYLMGHSQGGGGARHIAEKYAEIWAGVALLAPALFGAPPTADSQITKIPLLLAVGEKDSLLTSVRTFSEQLEALQVKHELVVKPGLDHGTIIMGAMPEVFAFFPRHVKK